MLTFLAFVMVVPTQSASLMKAFSARSLAAAGVPDPLCKTGVISLKTTGKPQSCCAGYCGECTDYETCKSVRGQDSANADQQKKRGFRSAMLYSIIAILGCAVVALSVVLGITINNKETISPNHALSVNSPYNVKFALHEPDVTKDLKPKQGKDVMSRYNYTHSTANGASSGILTSVNENLDMYMDITDQLAFGEMTNDNGQVTPYSLRIRVRNKTTGCDAFIVPFGISSRLVGDKNEVNYATLWPTFFHFSHTCNQDENVPVESESFVSELNGKWEFSNQLARASWDRTVVPWLTNYCLNREKEGHRCIMPDENLSVAQRRMLWTYRGVGTRVGGWAGGKVGGYAGGAIGGAVGGAGGSAVAGPVGGAVGGELGHHFGAKIGSHYGSAWGSKAGGAIGGYFDNHLRRIR